jgi:hypothetical protein
LHRCKLFITKAVISSSDQIIHLLEIRNQGPGQLRYQHIGQTRDRSLTLLKREDEDEYDWGTTGAVRGGEALLAM